jgi:exonuclease VII large subunit
MDREDIARSVAGMPVPVISGLGHADNVSLVDEVAWLAAATPTDAAQEVRRLVARTIIAAKSEGVSEAVVANASPTTLEAKAKHLNAEDTSTQPAPEDEAAQVADGALAASIQPVLAETEQPEFLDDPAKLAATEEAAACIRQNIGIADAIDRLPLDLVARIRAGSYPRAFGQHGRIHDAEQAYAEGALTLAFPDGMVPVKVILPDRDTFN